MPFRRKQNVCGGFLTIEAIEWQPLDTSLEKEGGYWWEERDGAVETSLFCAVHPIFSIGQYEKQRQEAGGKFC